MNPVRLLITVIAFAVLSMDVSHAQYFRLGKINEVKEVQKRPVLLMLEEEDPAILKRLSKKPGELKAYKDEIKRANEAMLALVPKFWTFNAIPVAKTKSEVESLLKAKNKEFSVLFLDRRTVTNYVKDGNIRYATGSKVIATLFIDIIENLFKGYPVYSQNLPNVFPTEGDIVIGLEMMQNFMTARLEGKKRNEISDEAKENKGLLANKTLLLDKEDIKDGLTPADIKEAYPYACKVVDYSVIEKAILEKDKSYAVVQIIPLSVGIPANAHLVINTEDGKSLGYYVPVQTTTLGGKNSMARIAARHLKNYAK